jgi:hypothetical protein
MGFRKPHSYSSSTYIHNLSSIRSSLAAQRRSIGEPMKTLFNSRTLRAVDRLVVTLDQHRFGAGVFLTIVLTVAATSLAVVLR